MNKWQITCPVVALLIGGVVMIAVVVKRQHRAVITAASRTIGAELISATNSSHLVRMSPYLRAQLTQLLGSPTHVATVLTGDDPGTGGLACSRLVLTNHAGQLLRLRLRQADRSGNFDVVGFRSSAP
jgi:hypothetical protein